MSQPVQPKLFIEMPDIDHKGRWSRIYPPAIYLAKEVRTILDKKTGRSIIMKLEILEPKEFKVYNPVMKKRFVECPVLGPARRLFYDDYVKIIFANFKNELFAIEKKLSERKEAEEAKKKSIYTASSPSKRRPTSPR